MSGKQLTRDKIKRMIEEAAKTRTLPKEGRAKELSGDELGAVTGGVGAWAFEHEGVVWSAFCNKSETTNAMLENCLVFEKACPYASPGASSCFDCHQLYVEDTGIRVE